MTEQLKKNLSDSKTLRWSVLALVAFTMLCGYFLTDVMSPLKPMLEKEPGNSVPSLRGASRVDKPSRLSPHSIAWKTENDVLLWKSSPALVPEKKIPHTSQRHTIEIIASFHLILFKAAKFR